MDKGDQELMFGPAYYGDPGVPHGDPELFISLCYGYFFAKAYKWALKDDAGQSHTSPFDHWLVAENSRLKRQWESLRKYKEGSSKKAPSVRDMTSAGEPRGKWDRVMMSGHFHMPSFQAYPHDFVYPSEKGDRPSNLPTLVPPHREIPLQDFQANTLEEDEYVLKAMELVGNDDLAPGEEGFDEEDKLAFMRAKLERRKLEMPENQGKANLDEMLEQTLEKDDAWQEEYVQAFSDIDDARLAFQEKIPLGRGEEFLLERASQQLPPEKLSDYTEAQLRGEEQMLMKKRVLKTPRFDDQGQPIEVKKRREIARARIQAEAEKKREAYVQRVQALESKLDKLDAEAADAEATGDPAAAKKVAALEKAEAELQALQDAQDRTESEVKAAIENFEDDEFVLYGKERDPAREWFERRERMRAQAREDGREEYYDEDDVEVAHRLYVQDAEKGGIDPIDAEFETDFTPEEQALINFQDETPTYPTLGIVRGNANTALRPQRLVDKSGVVFDSVDEEIRTHSRLTLDPTQEDPRFQEWQYRLLNSKIDGIDIDKLLPKEKTSATSGAPTWDDYIPVITKPESMLSRFFNKKMKEGMPPIATHDDDITPWGEESSANADLATYVERQLKVTGQKADEQTLKDLGIGWFTRPDGAMRIPRGTGAAFERKERLAYELYQADVAQRKTGPTIWAPSRSEAVDKYFNKLGKSSGSEGEAPVPEFEEIPRYPGYLFSSDGSGLGISPSGDYVVAMHTSDQLEAKTPKRVMSAAELKKAAPSVDWDGELRALGEAHGVEALASTKEERARILRQNAARKYRERAERFKDLDDQDVEFLEASQERLRRRAPQEKRVGGRSVKDVYAQHRQFSPLSVWTFVNGLRNKQDTEKWNASDQRRRYDLETQGFVTEDAPKEERGHWADKLSLFGPKSLTPLQREVVRKDQEKQRQDEKKWGFPGHWNMFKKAPREMLQPDVPAPGGHRGREAQAGRHEEKGGLEIFGFRIGGAPRDRPLWETRKDKTAEPRVFFPRELRDEDPREAGIDRSRGKPRRKEFMRDTEIRYPRLRDDYGIHDPDVRDLVAQPREPALRYEKDEDPVDPEFW